jgi:energy-coupling factor transporter ATP-binding protein EcfA2
LELFLPKEKLSTKRFYDAHRLCELNHKKSKWVVFCGLSGSGKSTSIQWLQDRYSDIDFLVIDEIRTVRELLKLVLLSNKMGKKSVLIASHVPAFFHRLIRPLFYPQVIVKTDSDQGQIEKWLTDQAIHFSSETVKRFKRRYGINYLDLGLVMKEFPGLNFDDSWHRFEKQCKVKRTPE